MLHLDKDQVAFRRDPGGENREGHVDASGEGEAHDKFHTQGSWVVLEEWSLLPWHVQNTTIPRATKLFSSMTLGPFATTRNNRLIQCDV